MNEPSDIDFFLHMTRDHSDNTSWLLVGEPPLGIEIKCWETDVRHDVEGMTDEIEANKCLFKCAPIFRSEVKRLLNGMRSILSDYDINELIRDVPEEDWNFEQQALVKIKELIE